MSSSNCCFLTCIQVSQEAGQVVLKGKDLQSCCSTLCDPVDYSTPGFPVCAASPPPRVCSNSCPLSQSGRHLIFCHSLLLLPSVFLSIRIFSNESALHIWRPKCCSFSFNISPSNEYSALIFFRIDWFYLLAVQGTLKSLFQHHHLKASILQHSKRVANYKMNKM